MTVLWIVTFIACGSSVALVDRVMIKTAANRDLKPQIERSSHLIIEILLLFSVFLMITANRTGVDIINYQNWYIRDEVVAGREILYTLLRNAAHASGMNFFVFRAIVTFISGVLPVIVLRKERINIAFFLAIYMPSLLFLDSMQFRNQISVSIVILGTYILIKKDDLKHKLVFAVFILFAMQFHTSAIMFLVFLPVCSKHKKIWDKFFLILGILLLAAAFVNNRTVPFINILYSRFLSSNDERNYLYGSGHNIFLYPTIVHILTSILLDFAVKWAKRDGWDTASYSYQYAQFINSANKMFFIFVPFVLMNTTFYRFLRNIFVFNIFAVGMAYKNSTSKNNRILMFFGLLMISILWIVFAVRFYSTVEIIIDPVLKDGIFFFIE